MPTFSATEQEKLEAILEKHVGLIQEKKFTEATVVDLSNIKDTAKQCFKILSELPLFSNATQHHIAQVKDNLIAQDENKISATVAALFHKELFNFDVVEQHIGLKENAQKQLLIKALKLELSQLKENEAKADYIPSNVDDYTLANYIQTKKAIPEHYFLDESDIRKALLQLAINHPNAAEKLLQCQFVSFKHLEDETAKSTALTQALDNIKVYPSSIVINTGGHWTQLVVKDQNNIEYIDSLAGTREARAYYDEILREAFTTSNNFQGKQAEIRYTGKQPDRWTCGYHVLADVAKHAGVTHSLDTDLRKEGNKKLRAMQDWAIQLISGKTLTAYEKELAILNTSQSKDTPLPTSSLSTQQPKLAKDDASMGGKDSLPQTSQRELFPLPHKTWLEKELFPKLGFDCTFEDGKQQFVLKPKDNFKNNEKPEIIVSSDQVSATNSQSLTDDERDKLAEQMLKIFIANELNLEGDQALPPIEEIKSKKIKAESLTGDCKKLKAALESKLDKYGITLLNQDNDKNDIIEEEEVIEEEATTTPSSTPNG